jgi:ribonuclease BN (tRNA processing enzyme)
VKLTFLGTRGYIEARSRLHRRHTSTLVAYRGREVLLDCGEDWRGRLEEMGRPRAAFITHAHPDHAGGLADGAPWPVFATARAWEGLEGYPLERGGVLGARQPVTVAGITLEPFTVQHSTRAPAVGYRITAGRVSVFYAPDLVYIDQRAAALGGCLLYVGDGASLDRSLVRKTGGSLIGHTPFRTQLTWCQKEGVPRAVATHCGSQIVAGDERQLGAKLREMAAERGVEAEIASDGRELVLRA